MTNNRKNKLYIVAKNTSQKETKDNATKKLGAINTINVLCFDDASKNTAKIILKTKELFENDFKVKINNIAIFNESYIDNFHENVSGYNVFYFARLGKYDYYKKLLAKNNIIEDDFEVIIEQKFSPTSLVIKRNDSYYKLFTVNRGNDESIYIKFDDTYAVKSCTRDINNSGKINLTPFSKIVKSPYISYHASGGVIHSNDSRGDSFINDLRSHNKDSILKNDFMFPLGCILPSMHHLHLLRNIGSPPLESMGFNYSIIGDNFTHTKITSDLKKQTYLCVDTDFLLPTEFVSFEIWIHKGIENTNIFSSLDDWQKLNVFNCITFNNKDSNITWSIVLRRVTAEAKKEYDNKFVIICTLGSVSEFLAYSLELQ